MKHSKKKVIFLTQNDKHIIYVIIQNHNIKLIVIPNIYL
jgi:uncharacterized pyridoxamine 5'-phosphate oxidase family protein